MDIRSQLIRDEGDQPSAYQDSLGYWTIGVGFLIDRRKGGRLPSVVRDYWLDFLVDANRRALRSSLPWYDRLDVVRQGVLLNMAYQLGVAGLLAFSETLARVRDGRYTEAGIAMLQSDWAKQTPQRAVRLSEQMKNGPLGLSLTTNEKNTMDDVTNITKTAPATTLTYVPPPIWRYFSTWVSGFAAFLFALPIDWINLDLTDLNWKKVYAAAGYLFLQYLAKKARQGSMVAVTVIPEPNPTTH